MSAEAQSTRAQESPIKNPGTFTLNRREFLEASALAAGSAFVNYNLGVISDIAKQTEQPLSPLIDVPENALTVEDDIRARFDLIDMATAGIIAQEFGRHVLYRGALKGNSLNAGTALELNLLAQARMWALKTFGGEEGVKLAEEEGHELFHSETYPVAVLVALSDWSNTHLAFDSDATFSEIAQMTIKPELEALKRPDIDSGTAEQWKAYKEKIDDQLYRETVEIAASTSVLAGITTYASSSLANQQKDRVLQSLWEQQYAKQIAEYQDRMSQTLFEQGYAGEVESRKQQNAPINDEDKEHIYQHAVQKANNLMNGKSGFSKLCMAGPSNGGGTKLIGDPPQAYFYLRNPNIKAIAVEEVVGNVQAEAGNLVLNTMWLKHAGVINDGDRSVPKTMAAILEREKLVYKAIGEKFADTMKRGDGQNFMATIREALQNVEDNAAVEEIRKLLDMVPPSKLDFNIADYVQSRFKFLQQVTTGKNGSIFTQFAESLLTIDHIQLSTTWADLQEKVDLKDPKSIANLESALKDIQENLPHAVISHALKELIETAAGDREADLKAEMQDQGNEAPPDPDKAHIYAQVINEVISLFNSFGSDDTIGLTTLLTTHANSITSPGTALKGLESEKVAGILASLRAAPRPASNHDDHDDEHQQTGRMEVLNDRVDRFLSALGLHPHAKEVLYALLTQLPAVPSIARLAKRATVDVHAESEESDHDTRSMRYIFGEIVPKNIAEAAGSETVYGNGPNFSQEVFELSPTQQTSSGTPHIIRRKLQPAESLVTDNRYAIALNASVLALGSAILIAAAPEGQHGKAAKSLPAILAGTNGISAVADNVAAYLFGANVIHAKMEDLQRQKRVDEAAYRKAHPGRRELFSWARYAKKIV